jgi:hypothetical protein
MDFCVYPENSRDKQRCLAPGGDYGPKVRGPMENRYLPILHKTFFLRELCGSNESCLWRDEWVVKKVNYFSLLVAIGKGTVDEIKMSRHGAYGSQTT